MSLPYGKVKGTAIHISRVPCVMDAVYAGRRVEKEKGEFLQNL